MGSSGYTPRLILLGTAGGVSGSRLEGVWVVSDKTRQPTHGDPEPVESSKMSFNSVEDQRFVFRTAKEWIARVIRKERYVTMFPSTRPFKRIALPSLSIFIRLAIIFRIRALL